MIALDYPVILTSFALSFIIVLLLTPRWIRRVRKAGFLGRDMNKADRRRIAELGGIMVIAGFLIGTLTYVAIDTFFIRHTIAIAFLSRSLQIMASLATVLIVAIIGLVDDILGWKIGLRQMHKPFLVLLAALPLVVINSGESEMVIPIIGAVNLGLLYPLVVVPIALSGAANGFNMLAGYNGLEAGMGAIILSTLAYVTWQNNMPHIAVMALCMVFALLAFYVYNKYPARIFPGDTLTYSVGAMIAIVAITGNAEKAALFLFIPYFIEFVLKARGRMRKESFAHVKSDGSLGMPYRKVYGLEHIAIKVLKRFKEKVYEKNVVHSIFAFEIVLAVIVLLGGI